MNNINVRAEMERAESRVGGYYQAAGFRTDHAIGRQQHIVGMISELDKAMSSYADASSHTLSMYNELRGMMLGIISLETENIKAGL